MTTQIQEDDAGVVFVVAIVDQDGNPLNISTATVTQFIFQRPDGTIATVNGSLFTDGTDGKLQYISTADLLDTPGTWKYQIHIIMGSVTLYSSISKFRILKNLPV